MKITSGKIKKAQKVVVYGPEGIGKSTFASQFPDPVFIDTEGSTNFLDVKRLPPPTSWTMILQQVKYVRANPDICKTLVVDTADWAEQLCTEHLVAMAPNAKEHGLGGIEGFGYGKGYTYLSEEFGRLLNLLTEVINTGINVIITAHAQMRKFDQPDEIGSYDRWELKLQKKTAALLKEWADMLLFASYETRVVNVDGQGAQKGKNKARGGKRVMHTSHNPCWDAKNRHNLDEKLDFDYSLIAHCIPVREATVDASTEVPVIPEEPKETPTATPAKQEPSVEEKQEEIASVSSPEPEQKPEPEPPKESPPEKSSAKAILPDELKHLEPLFDLMDANNVTPSEIQEVVADKGYFPKDTLFENYPKDFVEGVLIAAWPQVFWAIEHNRKHPF